MHPFEIREKRFRHQQVIAKLEEGDERQALEQDIIALQEICGHANFDEDPEKGWRCRDCDLTRPPEKQPEPEAQEEAAPESASA